MMDSLPNTRIVSAFYTNGLLTAALDDGRIIIFPCSRMKWLVQATPEQQQDFSVESDGYGVWWHELDDGIALHHLLSPTVMPVLEAVI